MATVDFSRSKTSANMMDSNLVSFGTFETGSAAHWSFRTSTGHDLEMLGDSMTFGADGRALTGNVHTIRFDLGNDDFGTPDVTITEADVSAVKLGNGQQSFWHFLEGDDTIVGGIVFNAGIDSFFTLFGDGLIGRGGSTGGDDVIIAGNTGVVAYGDVFEVGAPAFGNPGNTYRGGDDTISGSIGIKGATNRIQYLYGDAYVVHDFGELIGGKDSIFSTTVSSTAQVMGDAASVTDQAKLYGGDDSIRTISGSRATLVGDAGTQTAMSFVQGGNDTISGGDFANLIAGDVYFASGRLIGGRDHILAADGADTIAGDAYNGSGGMITGGDDFISGGQGDDIIFGEVATGQPSALTGGNDRIFGEAGNDQIHGQTGNDILDGATGADTLSGGAGNDVLCGGDEGDVLDGGDGFDMASYRFAGARVKASLTDASVGEGQALGDSFVAVEGLDGSNFNDILSGNAVANVLLGHGGADNLYGLAGNDLMEGGNAVDFLAGGAGNDQFRYTALNQGGDRINDFTSAAGNNDTFTFAGSVFGGLAKGALAASRFVASAAGVATTLDQRFVYETDTGILRYDANGSAAGGVTTIAVLTGAPILTAGDFLII